MGLLDLSVTGGGMWSGIHGWKDRVRTEPLLLVILRFSEKDFLATKGMLGLAVFKRTLRVGCVDGFFF